MRIGWRGFAVGDSAGRLNSMLARFNFSFVDDRLICLACELCVSFISIATLQASGGAMYFFIKSNNPRPTFHLDMSPVERSIMERHIAYWSEKAKQGIAVVFGPVQDPKGVYGIGVYKVKDEAEMNDLLEHDPAKGLLQYEVLQMPRAVVGVVTE